MIKPFKRGEKAMRALLTIVGLPDLPLLSLILVVVLILLAALMFGWIADLLLGENAYGTGFNAGIILIGAFVGAWLWHRYGFPTRFDPAAVKAGIATGSGLLLLLVLAVLRP
jgi:peptidoglycan/LPS O-acetylase OafA/YrhL